MKILLLVTFIALNVTTSIYGKDDSIVPTSGDKIILVNDTIKGEIVGKTIVLCDYDADLKKINNCNGITERTFYSNTDLKNLQKILNDRSKKFTAWQGVRGFSGGVLFGVILGSLLAPPSAPFVFAAIVGGTGVVAGGASAISTYDEISPVIENYEDGILKNEYLTITNKEFDKILLTLKKTLSGL